jgi:hypothetical protein
VAEKSFESHTSSRHEDSSIRSLHNLRSPNIKDSPKISSRPGSFSHDASSHSFNDDNKMWAKHISHLSTFSKLCTLRIGEKCSRACLAVEHACFDCCFCFKRLLINDIVLRRPAPLSASRTPSRQDSYLPDDSFSPNTNEDGVIVLRKLGLRNLPKMYVQTFLPWI